MKVGSSTTTMLSPLSKKRCSTSSVGSCSSRKRCVRVQLSDKWTQEEDEDLNKLTEHPAVLQKTTVTTSTVPTTPSLPKEATEGKPLKRKSLFNSVHSSFIAELKIIDNHQDDNSSLHQLIQFVCIHSDFIQLLWPFPFLCVGLLIHCLR